MASHSAAAYALMRHDEMKAAAHGQPKPLPTASFDSLGAADLPRPVPKTKQLRNLESMFTVSECLAQLLSAASIDLPAARSALEKI